MELLFYTYGRKANFGYNVNDGKIRICRMDANFRSSKIHSINQQLSPMFYPAASFKRLKFFTIKLLLVEFEIVGDLLAVFTIEGAFAIGNSE